MAEPPFKPHMSLETATQLNVNDMVDYRMSTGQFSLVKITTISGENVKVYHNNGYSVWCNYSTELYKLAKPESISKRPAHRFQDLKVGDSVDINPIQRHPGWKAAEVKKIDSNSGQIQVIYQYDNKNYIHWSHVDDTNEVAVVATKSVASDHDNATSQITIADQQMLTLALQISMDNNNNVNADDLNSDIQRVLKLSMDTENNNPQSPDVQFQQVIQQSIASHSVEQKLDNDALCIEISETFQYNKDVIDQLVSLGFDRNECIQASSMVINYNDINRVADKVQSLKDKVEDKVEAKEEKKEDNVEEVNAASDVSRPNNKMKIFMQELEELISIIQKRLDFMDQQDSIVSMLIASSNSVSLLQSAKHIALKTEKDLLEQIMNLHEINTFLNNIILVENLFNSQYDAKQKEEQKNARNMYARNISVYENKPKPICEIDSFVELLFAGTNLHIGQFRNWLDLLKRHCLKRGINISHASDAKGKNIERAFYKSFYVYGMKSNDGFKQITDVLRCSLVFDNFGDLYKCWAMIERLSKENGHGILRCKDRFNPDTMPFGYRDLLINIYCPQSKIVCEIQLHHQLFYQYKKVSHSIYKKARLFEQNDMNLAYNYSNKHNRKHIGDKVYEINESESIQQENNKNDGDRGLLKEWNLEQYSKVLIDEKGYEDIEDWQGLTLNELQEMGFKEGQAKKFMRKVKHKLQNI